MSVLGNIKDEIASIFSNDVEKKDPELVMADLGSKQSQLRTKMRNFRREKEKHRKKAKEYYKSGDQNKFQEESRKYGYSKRKEEVFGNVNMMIGATVDALALQKDMSFIVNISKDVQNVVAELGVDPKQITASINTLNKTMRSVFDSANQLDSQVDQLMKMQEGDMAMEDIQREIIEEAEAEDEVLDKEKEIERERA